MNPVISSDLKNCRLELEALQQKSQQKHLRVWSELNPDLEAWTETAAGYIQSFDFVNQFENSPSGSPEFFLYSNAVQSCVEFSEKYSFEIKKQEYTAGGALIFLAMAFMGTFMLLPKLKKSLLAMGFLFLTLFLPVSAKGDSADKSLRVYTYDALTGRNSFGEYLSKKFFEKHGVKVQFLSFGTAGEALNQIVLEGKKTKADLLMGIDEVLFRKVATKDLFEGISSNTLVSIEPHLKTISTNQFVPFDYGYLAFVYDDSRTAPIKSVALKGFPEMLTERQKVVIQDPRTSSLGIEFLVWSFESLGENAKDFWLKLAPHILTVSPGWSGAYELFLRKQVEFVISFTTSPAYHRMREKKYSIRPLIFEEGHFKQIEGITLLKTSNQKENANRFIQFVLSEEVQKQVPTFQWMYPARVGTPLPLEFRDLPIPKDVRVNWERVLNQKDQWIRDWTLMLSRDQK